MPSRRWVMFATGALALAGTPGIADSPAGGLPRPQGRVILTVTGSISRTNAPGKAEFDLAMLEQLGLHRLTTWTPWTEGSEQFQGVLARRLLEAVGARGSEVFARALNDFKTTIPVDDFQGYDVLLATRMNGAPLAVRDKGPIWVVYPWSDHPELDDMVTRRKSVWQLRHLHVQ